MHGWLACLYSTIVRITIWSATEWCMRVIGARCLAFPAGLQPAKKPFVMRNILLAELCDHHIHCQHISTAGSVRLLREAQARSVKISGEVCPHHIALTDEAIQHFD